MKEGKDPTKSTVVLRTGLSSELEDDASMPSPTVLFSAMAVLDGTAALSRRPPEGTRECVTLGCMLGLRLYDASSRISTSSSLSLFSLEALSS